MTFLNILLNQELFMHVFMASNSCLDQKAAGHPPLVYDNAFVCILHLHEITYGIIGFLVTSRRSGGVPAAILIGKASRGRFRRSTTVPGIFGGVRKASRSVRLRICKENGQENELLLDSDSFAGIFGSMSKRHLQKFVSNRKKITGSL